MDEGSAGGRGFLFAGGRADAGAGLEGGLVVGAAGDEDVEDGGGIDRGLDQAGVDRGDDRLGDGAAGGLELGLDFRRDRRERLGGGGGGAGAAGLTGAAGWTGTGAPGLAGVETCWPAGFTPS